MTYNTSIEIRGCINVAGAIHLDPAINRRTAKPLVFECGAALLTPPSVDAFQEALFKFLHVCSKKLSPDLSRILLEGMVMQPRGVAKWVNKRTQNPEKMLREARAGRLPLLAISGGKDELLIVEGFKKVFEDLEWKGLTYRHLQDADHIPWVSCAEEFRETVLAWLKESTS
jgi:pimeloyl-ACP methyl ester carboxylesterase